MSSCSSGVGGGDDRAQARLVDGDGREDDGLGEDALLDEPVAEAPGGVRVAHHDRRDRASRRRPVSKPRRVSSALKDRVFVPETFLELGLVLHDLDRLAAGGDDGGRMRRREEERSRALGQDLAQCHGAGDVATERPDGLRQRADLDRHPAVQAEVIDRATPVPAEDAAGVGVVDHDGRTERLGRLDDPGEWRDVAIHREDPVGHDQDQPVLPAARPAGLARLAEDLAQRLDVGVRDRPFAAPSTAASRR